MEDFSPPPSPTPVDFNEDDILDAELPFVFDPRSTVSGTDGNQATYGNHKKASEKYIHPSVFGTAYPTQGHVGAWHLSQGPFDKDSANCSLNTSS